MDDAFEKVEFVCLGVMIGIVLTMFLSVLFPKNFDAEEPKPVIALSTPAPKKPEMMCDKRYLRGFNCLVCSQGGVTVHMECRE